MLTDAAVYVNRHLAKTSPQCRNASFAVPKHFSISISSVGMTFLNQNRHFGIEKSCLLLQDIRVDEEHAQQSCLPGYLLLQDIKVEEGACSAVLPTSARLSDQQGHLHAGCYCSLVDLISTTALASADKRPAVTVTISVDFFAPLPIGEDLMVESHMVKAGKTLTFAEVSFR